MTNSETNRKWKDSVFTKYFAKKEIQLELLKSLHPEREFSINEIENVTLQNVITNGIYNDLGIKVGNDFIILIEAQSTWSPNILTRGFVYMAETLKQTLANKNLFAEKKVDLPRLELYVVYADGKNQNAPSNVMSFTQDFFEGSGSSINIEATVFSANNNPGGVIGEYIEFVNVMTQSYEEHGKNRIAQKAAIQKCKENGIMTEFLSKCEMEVIDIMEFLFDEQKIQENYTKEQRQEGVAEERGRLKKLKEKLVQAGAIDFLLDALGCDEKIEALYEQYGIE